MVVKYVCGYSKFFSRVPPLLSGSSAVDFFFLVGIILRCFCDLLGVAPLGLFTYGYSVIAYLP